MLLSGGASFSDEICFFHMVITLPDDQMLEFGAFVMTYKSTMMAHNSVNFGNWYWYTYPFTTEQALIFNR